MNYLSLYSDFLKKSLKPLRLAQGERKLKVVFDCSNGVTSLVVKKLFQNAKIEAIFINDKIDGDFPAHGPNPLVKNATKQLEKEVLKQKADLGVIFDGDGDRVFFLDNKGRWIDPNESAYILMQMLKPPYVVGIVSSWRLKKSKVFVSRVGHYFFKNLMRKKKASLGLEHSGHYYFKNFFYCDSGIFAAIQVINFVSGLDINLSDWLDNLPKYYRSGEINFKVQDKEKVLKAIERKYKNQADKILKVDGITMEFGGGLPSEALAKDWWFNVRSSNTENRIRLNIEAKNKQLLNTCFRELKKILSNA